MCHSKTKNICFISSSASILISSTEKNLIDKKMVKKDVIITDVGITNINNYIYGDVNSKTEKKASYLIPISCGVGPMTVCILLKNIMLAYRNQNKEEKGK